MNTYDNMQIQLNLIYCIQERVGEKSSMETVARIGNCLLGSRDTELEAEDKSIQKRLYYCVYNDYDSFRSIITVHIIQNSVWLCINQYKGRLENVPGKN
jgi:hypothetical protein